MQSTQFDLRTLRSTARARGFEIDLSRGQLELFTASWPANDERTEREAQQWLEHYCQE